MSETAYDPMDQTFFCTRREMPVMKDTTDCWGCPMKTYPSPCAQYAKWKAIALQGGDLVPALLKEPSVPGLTEPSRSRITE
jgi:hypothetical protein